MGNCTTGSSGHQYMESDIQRYRLLGTNTVTKYIKKNFNCCTWFILTWLRE